MKFSLTKNTKQRCWVTLYQIKAEKSFCDVSKGDLWGRIEKEDNLSQNGNARIYANAQVSENARIFGNARVSGNVRIFENAQIFGDAQISGDIKIFGNARVSGNAQVFGKIKLQSWRCFARKEKDWNISEIENEWIILMIKDYKLVEEGKDTEVERAIKFLKKKKLVKELKDIE